MARIRQLRLMMLVHSYIYYHLNDSLISDHEWQALGDELVILQADRYEIGCYDEAFYNWDASTGFHLPTDSWVRSKALYLLRISRKPAPRLRQRLIAE